MMDLAERGACREYTPPRDDEYHVLVGSIRGHTKIGPVREVRVPSRGLSSPEESINMWKKFTENKENLCITKRWQPVPARINQV